jgi:hypothetical protein
MDMKHVWGGVVAALGIFLVLFHAVPSAALVMLTKDSTDIGKIVIVSPTAGDSAAANGTALINALTAITATSAEPYVLKLGPGVYDVQGTSVQMKEYVDIEGSGEKTTKITGTIGSETSSPSSGTVQGANNAELRFLTVENTGTGTNAVAILNSSSSPSIMHVTATASAGNNNYGIYNTDSSPKMTDVSATGEGGAGTNAGVYNSNGYPVMTNVIATGSGGTWTYGVYNDYFNLTMTNVIAIGSGVVNGYGIYNNAGGVIINHSVINGPTPIHNGGAAVTRVVYTQLDGLAVENSGGTLTCVGAYDGGYSALGTNCLP